MNRSQQIITGLALLGLVVLGLGVLPVLAQNGGIVELIGGDEASLRRFILRTEGLLTAGDSNVTILIEDLPEDLPFELPLPQGARAIGSITVAWPGTEPTYTHRLVIDTTLQPEALLEFFAENLTAAPWEHLSTMNSSGFVEGGIATDMYCYGDDTTVNINAWRLPAGSTDLQIYIDQDTGSAMCGGGLDMTTTNPALGMLPRLPRPDGVSIESPQYNNAGRNKAFTSATLRTDLLPGELIELYNDGLAAQGWTHVQTESTATFAWSGWTFTTEEGLTWSGTLTLTIDPTLLDSPTDRLYTAQVTVQQLDGE